MDGWLCVRMWWASADCGRCSGPLDEPKTLQKGGQTFTPQDYVRLHGRNVQYRRRLIAAAAGARVQETQRDDGCATEQAHVQP